MDDRYDEMGAIDARDVLASDPIYALVGRYMQHAIVFAAVLVLLVSLAIVFGPSSESRFIYTDF